jgi:hypothetical protein
MRSHSKLAEKTVMESCNGAGTAIDLTFAQNGTS